MSVADLNTALDNIDAAIAALSATSVDSGSIDGLTVDRKTMAELVADRMAILDAIAKDGGNLFEFQGVWVP